MIELTIRGEPLWVHENEELSNHIRRENDYFEAEILDFISINYPSQHTIVDVGANIGNHTNFFARFLTYNKIFAFEPIPDNYDVLEKNTERFSNVFPSTFAIAEANRNISMYINRRNMGMSGWAKDGEITAPAISLDSLSLEDVTLLKIDVENFEPLVLEGARETIRKSWPLILIEDNFDTYPPLLPDYEIVKDWQISKNYLYEKK